MEIIDITKQVKDQIRGLVGSETNLSGLDSLKETNDLVPGTKGIITADGFNFIYEINDHQLPVFFGPYNGNELISLVADKCGIAIPGYEMDLLTTLDLFDRVCQGEEQLEDIVEKKRI